MHVHGVYMHMCVGSSMKERSCALMHVHGVYMHMCAVRLPREIVQLAGKVPLIDEP